jgi:hypothetical protein
MRASVELTPMVLSLKPFFFVVSDKSFPFPDFTLTYRTRGTFERGQFGVGVRLRRTGRAWKRMRESVPLWRLLGIRRAIVSHVRGGGLSDAGQVRIGREIAVAFAGRALLSVLRVPTGKRARPTTRFLGHRST